MTRRWSLLLIATAACARGGTNTPTPDAQPDAADCAEQTYYRDADGDGHGDPASPVDACEPPAGTVQTRDDCDDNNAQRHPALAEICDGLDNDCNATSVEQCPAGCTAQRRAPPDNTRVYLVCNVAMSWTAARATCGGAMFKLVQIDDAVENAYVRNAATAVFGTVDIHIGASDSVTESLWTWEGSGDTFWQGGPAPGGVPVGGRYANWEGAEPNNSGDEDCAEMRPSGQWNDDDCGDAQRFICRR